MNDLQPYKSITKYEDFLNDKIPERRFRLVYPYKEIFYLTQDERDYLLTQIKAGAEWIEIGEHTFTKNFTVMYPIRDSQLKKHYREVKNETGTTIKYEEV